MKRDAESLKTGVKWVGAGLGAGLPAMSFFTNFPPPLFPKVSFLTSALAGAILLIAAVWKPREPRTSFMPKAVKLALKCLVPAVGFLTCYIILFQFTTITSPQESGIRFQIGFGTVDWSLTHAGKQWKQGNPDITPKQMAMNEAALDQERVAILWQPWSIYAAGCCLILCYLLGFLFWTSGFALLAKHQKQSRRA